VRTAAGKRAQGQHHEAGRRPSTESTECASLGHWTRIQDALERVRRPELARRSLGSHEPLRGPRRTTRPSTRAPHWSADAQHSAERCNAGGVNPV
jgi:hypothetical protein